MVDFTRSPSWLAVAVSAGALAVAPEAEAKCARPSAVLAPSSGSVPPRPVLELLMPDWEASATPSPPRVVARIAGGAARAALVKPDTAADALKTFRVEIGAAQPGPLEVDLLDAAGATVRSWSLVIDAGWRAPAASLAKITTRQEHARWTCSHTRTTNLAFDGDAWAYRVVAASSRADLAAGRTRSFVLPRSTRLFWAYDASAPPPAVDVALGYANCFGDTFDWTRGAVVANVLALEPDGTEQPVTSAPIRIGSP